jgi:hypothetical protein
MTTSTTASITLNNVLVEEVDVSFYDTVYSSIKYIKKSLTSIAEAVLELEKHGKVKTRLFASIYFTEIRYVKGLNHIRRKGESNRYDMRKGYTW